MKSGLKRQAAGALALLAAIVSSRAEFVADAAAMRRLQPEHYLCIRSATPVQIDGKLDDPAWQSAAWTRDFQDIEGSAKPRPRFRTRAKMAWDEQYFYVAAVLEEPHVWGTLTNHDAVIFQDPDFEVFIDPDGDRHNYYEFEMNVLNTTWDLLLKKAYIDGGPAVNEWEIPGLRTAVHVNGTLNDPSDTDQSWSLEIAFPWRALAQYSKQSAPPKNGDVWRVDFSRVEWQIDTTGGTYKKVPKTKEDNWVWSPTGIIDMHRPEKWGLVEFSNGSRSSRTFPTDPAREAVLEGYYRQKAFHAKNGHWAKSIEELNTLHPAPAGGVKLRLKSTAEGWEISSETKSAGSRRGSVHIRQDGLLWEGR